MEGEYQLQEEEQPGEKERREREKRQREEWERKSGAINLPGAAVAQEYGEKIAETASMAREYVSDRVSVVGDKLRELNSTEFGQITENAKEYTRRNPGRALLFSAATGLIVGLIIRGSRR